MRVCRIIIVIYGLFTEHVWNAMAHAQNPDFVFQPNGRVHLNRPVGGASVQSTAGSRGVRIGCSNGSNTGYTTFWGRVRLKCDGTRQKPHLVFQRNGRIYINRQGASNQSTTAQPKCAHLQDYWLPTLIACFPFTSPTVRHRVPSHFSWCLPINSPLLNIPSHCSVLKTPVYNDIGLYDTPPITSDVLWHQLIPHC
jgi:hypothetical protein